ncbi:MAG: hypothetical protein JNK72_24685 [Myxococcales bacterium]|nr:hypothetical protein [Myxococcales bacterium]
MGRHEVTERSVVGSGFGQLANECIAVEKRHDELQERLSHILGVGVESIADYRGLLWGMVPAGDGMRPEVWLWPIHTRAPDCKGIVRVEGEDITVLHHLWWDGPNATALVTTSLRDDARMTQVSDGCDALKGWSRMRLRKPKGSRSSRQETRR